jgi:protein involved in polysaccharide export with SLBB domain
VPWNQAKRHEAAQHRFHVLRLGIPWHGIGRFAPRWIETRLGYNVKKSPSSDTESAMSQPLLRCLLITLCCLTFAPVFAASRDYVLSPGDVIKLTVSDQADLSSELRLNDTGVVNFTVAAATPQSGNYPIEVPSRLVDLIALAGRVTANGADRAGLAHNSRPAKAAQHRTRYQDQAPVVNDRTQNGRSVAARPYPLPEGKPVLMNTLLLLLPRIAALLA